MIKKSVILIFMFLTVSCSGVDFVLKDEKIVNPFKNKTSITFAGTLLESFSQEMFKEFGQNKSNEYTLITNLTEKKENRLVQKKPSGYKN